ncbi:CoA pyrophosphatase [Endozoicomonas sp. SCSIO W0465]|uniref:CoA pyrophosphatase n=1 Tax=Endozoicomonas sp. SCSIO W0465 TaxID=2918516 RepID=UPI002074FB5E|nr:CoA pyrophosphatase [Endozoicomonas sp. SCSIO W0465]USE34541.1 CoA pyrophosphatase [Endozoicomonas sp. SCSIO W0465]
MDATEVAMMLNQVEERLKDYQPRKIDTQLPEAAVLIPITNTPEPELVFTRRATHMSTHSGEVAFPGGKRDPSDSDLIHTALRESLEEINLPPENVRIIGQTGSVISRFGLEVTPVVGIMEAHSPLRPNMAELDRIFRVPLSYFLEKENLTFNHWKMRNQDYKMPSFYYGEYLIWGLTAVMLVEFLNITLDAGIPLNAPHFNRHFTLQKA